MKKLLEQFRNLNPRDPGAWPPLPKAMLLLGVLVVASGLSIWKPVQLDALADLFGGYDTARRVHFVAMAGIVAFVVVHLALVLIVPSTLLPMLTGRAPRHARDKTAKQEQQA